MGASIKIQSESKQFQDDMKKLTQDLKLMESELSVATQKADLFGTEQDKAKAKVNELGQKLQGQTSILNLQKQALAAITSDTQKYQNRNDTLKTSIEATEKALKNSLKATGEDSTETKKLTTELSKMQSEFSKNEKEITKLGKNESDLKIKINDSEKAILQDNKALQDNEKELEKTSEGTSKFKGHLDDIKAAMGAVGLASLNYLKGAVDKGAAAEVSTKVLANELKNQGLTAEQASEGIKKFQSSITSMSTFTGGEAKEALAVFTQKGIDMNTALKASSTVADVAKGKNISLSESADMLADAYNGKTKAMVTLGILSKDEVKNLEGQENAGIRLDEVQKRLGARFGGSAKEEMSTYNGQLEVTQNNMGSLKTTIGSVLLPVLTKMATKINEVIKPILDFLKAHPKITAIVLGLVGIFGTLIGGLSLMSKLSGLLTGVLPMLTPIMTFVTGIGLPVIAIVVGIGLVVAAVIHLWKTNSEFRDNVMTLVKTLKDFVMAIFNDLKEFWKIWGGEITATFKVVWDLVSTIFNTVVKIIADVFRIFAALFKGDWKGLWDAVKTLFKDVWDGVISILKSYIKAIDSVIKTVIDIISAPFIAVKNKVVGIFNEMIDSITGFFKKIKIPTIGVDVKWGGPADAIPYPSFNVKWHAEGGIFSKPTLLGGNNGVGEAGAEAVLPLSQLWSQLEKNFDKLEKTLDKNNNAPQIVFNGNYSFRNEKDIDYFMNQSGQLIQRRKG